MIGAGTMGAGIAQMTVAGHDTVLIDAEPGRAGRSVDAMGNDCCARQLKGECATRSPRKRERGSRPIHWTARP
ncbi:3-hydroxyacyl-CoA dehydrogenase NAD-binding domain-containing protein [Nocardia nepalensis]|uniref:3-hydroxyacyl-CoA dehydrogenase NAD-binding domain-containing protein n=1 Tax=Nocardia nepalensis TaxID=3375448 RepID=UPI003B67F74A